MDKLNIINPNKKDYVFFFSENTHWFSNYGKMFGIISFEFAGL